MYDTLMRLPLLGWVLFAVTLQLAVVIQSFSTGAVYAIHIAMQLSTIVFMMLIAAAVILRTRPSGKAGGLEPRISALLGTYWGDSCSFAAWPLILNHGGEPRTRHQRVVPLSPSSALSR